MKAVHHLFVYGSLREGQGNHYHLDGGRLIARTQVEGYRMFSLGGFPGIQALEGAIIEGEVYEIDDTILARCDRLEGHPNFYERTLVPFNGAMMWVYVYAGDARQFPSIISRMEGNQIVADWVQHKNIERSCQGAQRAA